jgi:hypothetical protein
MLNQAATRPPAPELSPDELLTVIEFGIHEGADS